MNIIELAKEAGLGRERWTTDEQLHAFLECFASLVRAEREWIDLTDDEISTLWYDSSYGDSGIDFARAVIAAFKEKQK